VYSERCRLRPWGLRGGMPGEPSNHYVVRSTGEVVSIGCKATIVLNKGDTIYINTPGGGGYGDPCSRPREEIERDLREGKVTVESAKRYYCYKA
jgi:N-methylhydantoinase B